MSDYENGKRLMCEHVIHLKKISVEGGSDTIINESISVPRRLMKVLLLLLLLLLLFYKPYVAGVRDSEKTSQIRSTVKE